MAVVLDTFLPVFKMDWNLEMWIFLLSDLKSGSHVKELYRHEVITKLKVKKYKLCDMVLKWKMIVQNIDRRIKNSLTNCDGQFKTAIHVREYKERI